METLLGDLLKDTDRFSVEFDGVKISLIKNGNFKSKRSVKVIKNLVSGLEMWESKTFERDYILPFTYNEKVIDPDITVSLGIHKKLKSKTEVESAIFQIKTSIHRLKENTVIRSILSDNEYILARLESQVKKLESDIKKF